MGPFVWLHLVVRIYLYSIWEMLVAGIQVSELGFTCFSWLHGYILMLGSYVDNS